MPEPLLFRQTKRSDRHFRKMKAKACLESAGGAPCCKLHFLIPMWPSRCVGEHSGSTLFGSPSARINWRHELARMISGLSKEALDKVEGSPMAGSTVPEALHRGKKCFVGRDAPLKEQLGRSHYGRFPLNMRLPKSGLDETGDEPISDTVARKRGHTSRPANPRLAPHQLVKTSVTSY